ncbi:MAG: DUF2336 domain-containing protein [Rhodospirillales bacterium]|nr:DUF2336 domain-containing protein [Rhodospirillales bacterium]
MKSIIGKLFGSGKGREVTYDQAKELANHKDDEIRRELASQPEIRPEILYYLTDDPSPVVRAEVAKNQATPAQADLLLAKDRDDDVRVDLAAKISRLAPGLSANEHDQVKVMAYEALEILARDQVVRVRQIISETLKDIADAPPEIIRQLAWDAEALVSGPILEYSPVLTDNDLLEIIKQSGSGSNLKAISKRSKVSESVVDAIVETSEEDAIGFLLANKSAQIREETLDKIIAEAINVESWHAPLVVRPRLSETAAMNLARFVAENLLTALTSRKDFAPEVIAAVRTVVNKRLESQDAASVADEESTDTPLQEAHAQASKLHGEGALTEAAVLKAMDRNQRTFVVAALSVLTDLTIIKMEKAVRQKDPKGMVAIAWKAGLSTKVIEALQRDISGIAEEKIIKPADNGLYPLSDSDLEWQFEVMTDIV